MPTANRRSASKKDLYRGHGGIEGPVREPLDSASSKSKESLVVKMGAPRQIAKSKNPLFRPATFYVRKKTYAECDYQLRNDDDPRDMSELIEDLMTRFLAEKDISAK